MAKTSSETGVAKRDIVFTGDALHTLARVYSKCNKLGVNFQLSKNLMDKLELPQTSMDLKEIRKMDLRGKEHSVALSTL